MKFKFNTVILVPGTQWWLSRPYHMTRLPSTMTMRGVFFVVSVILSTQLSFAKKRCHYRYSQAGFKLLILLPQSPKYCDYRLFTSRLVHGVF